MNLTDLVRACDAHRPTAIVLAPDDFHDALAFAERAYSGDWLATAGRLTYRGVPILRSTEWQRSYLLEDCHEGPLIHVIG